MKLTELKEKIDAALKLHDDYDVKILVEDYMDYHTLDADEVNIDPGKFNFNISINITRLIDDYYT